MLHFCVIPIRWRELQGRVTHWWCFWDCKRLYAMVTAYHQVQEGRTLIYSSKKATQVILLTSTRKYSYIYSLVFYWHHWVKVNKKNYLNIDIAATYEKHFDAVTVLCTSIKFVINATRYIHLYCLINDVINMKHEFVITMFT